MHTNRQGVAIVAMVGLACLSSTSAAAEPRTHPFATHPQATRVQRVAGAHVLTSALPLTSTAARLPQNVSPDIVWVECSPDAQAFGALCGQLAVPLDRIRPNEAQINIYFEIYSHTNPGPAVSAILANAGGPGLSTTSLRGYAVTLFAANLDAHDILLIDDRGRGLSATIDCDELQHGTTP